MFPDPKKMFDSTDEENRKAYGKGARDARKAGAGKRLYKDLEDAFDFFPDKRKSSHKSYDAGWRDNAYSKDRSKKSKNQGKSSSNSYGGSTGSSGDDPLHALFDVVSAIPVILVVIFAIGLCFNPNLVDDIVYYLNLSNHSRESRNKQTVWTMGMVNTLKLNVRSNPGANSPIVAQFNKGARLAFTGEPVKNR